MLLPSGERLMHLPYSYKEPIFKACGYEPFHNQEPFHRSKAKHRIFVGGNRAGKSEALSMEALVYLTWPRARIWIVTRTYDLGKPLVDKVIDRLVYSLGFTQRKTRHNLTVGEFYWSEKSHTLLMWNGAMLEIKSADNPDSLHGHRIDVIIIDEAALFQWELYDTRLVPRLADSGGWIASGGTFEYLQGDWFTEYYEMGLQWPNEYDIQSWSQPTTKNPHIDQEWLAQEKIRLCRTAEGERVYRARYLAEPVASAYLVFPGWSVMTHESRVHGGYRPGLPVWLAIDPGGVYAVGVMQFKPLEGRGNKFGMITACLIDSLYFTETVETLEVIAECEKRAWWKDLEGGAIDVAAVEQHRIWTRRTKKQFLRKKVPIQAGNQTLQHWLSTETFLSHPDNTVWNYEMNRYAFATPAVGKEDSVDIRRGNPKDSYNHLIKAVIYLLVNKFGYYRRTRAVKQRAPLWGGSRRRNR